MSTMTHPIATETVEVRELSVAKGASFTQQDVDGANKVALLGKTLWITCLETWAGWAGHPHQECTFPRGWCA